MNIDLFKLHNESPPKVRKPYLCVLWVLLTGGIYAFVWLAQIHKELPLEKGKGLSHEAAIFPLLIALFVSAIGMIGTLLFTLLILIYLILAFFGFLVTAILGIEIPAPDFDYGLIYTVLGHMTGWPLLFAAFWQLVVGTLLSYRLRAIAELGGDGWTRGIVMIYRFHIFFALISLSSITAWAVGLPKPLSFLIVDNPKAITSVESVSVLLAMGCYLVWMVRSIRAHNVYAKNAPSMKQQITDY